MSGARTPWQKTTVSTGGVQNAFVRTRLAEINQAGDGLEGQTIELLRTLVPEFKKSSTKKLRQAYQTIKDRLQEAPLTINFRAWSWFMKENNYDTYTQMYERAIKSNGMMVLDNFDTQNPARLRAAIDDKVTFPSSWMQTAISGLSTPSAAKATRTIAAAAPGARRGQSLSPDFARSRIIEKMSPGDLKPVHADRGDAAAQKYEAANLQFNPKTKQLFTALNYGRRYHGSTKRYGHSYMRLSSSYKKQAIYFAGDTFYCLMGFSNSAEDQLTYDTLGALLMKAYSSKPPNSLLVNDIIASCLWGATLPDTDEEKLLVEAHLFKGLNFSEGLDEICISAKDNNIEYWENDTKKTRPGTEDEFGEIATNAIKFARKHDCKITFIE